jgi:hypothetical protein
MSEQIVITATARKDYSLVKKSELTRYTTVAITSLNLTKREAFSPLDAFYTSEHLEYDYALPQEWLDAFVKECGLEYHLVMMSTVFVYRGQACGPVSCVKEVQEALERYYYNY